MPQRAVDQKSSRSATPAATPAAHTSAYAVALAPPAYGIDVADKQPAEMHGATIQRQEESASHGAAPGIP